ncbi:MAG: VOC family protein [Lachnospiraceae bacterium]|nr:VOC family protein [Lachnospiraceae bacterium]
MSELVQKITQIGIVTKDARAMARRYEEIYGIGGWTILDGEKGFDPAAKAQDLTTRGVKRDFEITLALSHVGEMEIELIQPLDEYSDYSRFLREHGEGVHHISIITDVKGFKKQMEEREIPVLMSGRVPGVETFTYYDCGAELGMILEIHDTENC